MIIMEQDNHDHDHYENHDHEYCIYHDSEKHKVPEECGPNHAVDDTDCHVHVYDHYYDHDRYDDHSVDHYDYHYDDQDC